MVAVVLDVELVDDPAVVEEVEEEEVGETPTSWRRVERDGGTGMVAPTGTKATVIIWPLRSLSAVGSPVESAPFAVGEDHTSTWSWPLPGLLPFVEGQLSPFAQVFCLAPGSLMLVEVSVSPG